MTIKYLDSKRMSGDTADIAAVSGGWKEIGRTTLGSAADTITVSGLPDKRYYMIISSKLVSGNATHQFILNNDTGSNYAIRYSGDGGAEYAGVSLSNINFDPANATNSFHVGHIANLSSKEKIGIHHLVNQNTAGAGTSTRRSEFVSKWANTSSSMNRIDLKNTDSGNFDTGSEIVVLGWDDSDTHTSNFWEELASVNASGSSTNLSSGTITAKKYLWIQCYSEGTGGDILTTFNNDTGSNYTRRFSIDGGADGTSVNETSIANMHNAGLGGDDAFSNWFIINNSANEKLVIGHSVQNGSAGAGTAPLRLEFVNKWANTSSQITEIDFDSQSGNFGSDSIIKVWGSN